MYNFYENDDVIFPPYDDEAYWEYLMEEAAYYAGEGDLQGSLPHNMQMTDYSEMTGRDELNIYY